MPENRSITSPSLPVQSPLRKEFKWVLDAVKREEYTILFKSLDSDKDGFINGSDSQAAFAASNLDKEILGRIW